MHLIKATLIAAACAVFANIAKAEQSAAARYGAQVEEMLADRRLAQIEKVQRAERLQIAAIASAIDAITNSSPDRYPDMDLMVQSLGAQLGDLGLPQNELLGAASRLSCLERQLTVGASLQDCAINIHVPDTPNDWHMNAGLDTFFTGSTTELFDARRDARAPLSVFFYGHAVDLNIGELLELIAERNPDVLQPILVNRPFQNEQCVSGIQKPAIVPSVAGHANALHLQQLDSASRPTQAGGTLWRWTLNEASLPELRARTDITGPMSLLEVGATEAQALITASFKLTYGLEAADPTLANALRNLWIAQGDAFELILSNTLGQSVSGSELGRLVIAQNNGTQAFWKQVLEQAALVLHCRDADRVYEAYGLTYRQGDYPSARRVMRLLEARYGYVAVPGVRVIKTQRRLIETVPQDCALFGPVEMTLNGTSSDECNLRTLSVDGRIMTEVVAGGVEVRFNATPDGQRAIREALAIMRDRDRDGDKLRWRLSGGTPIGSQNSAISMPHLVMGPDVGESDIPLPCVVSLSRSSSFDNVSALTRHVRDYRRYFYPSHGQELEPLIPDDYSFIFLLDNFDGYRTADFTRDMEDAAKSMAGMRASILQMATTNFVVNPLVDGGIGLTTDNALSDVLRRTCELLISQMNAEAQDVSHGEFVRQLLVGDQTTLGAFGGVGILDPDGKHALQEYEAVKSRLVGDKFSGLQIQTSEARLMLEGVREVARANSYDDQAGTNIFNVSMGQDMRLAATRIDEAQQDINLLREQLALVGSSGLFVVAAGQPPIPEGLDPAQVLGAYLRLKPANLTYAGDRDCSWFPACLSKRSNVITVGAVRPSAGENGHEIPSLMPWTNHGPAVTLAAPGEGVLANDFGYIWSDDSVTPVHTSAVRDGTSVSTVFVTALAAQLAAHYPFMKAGEIKTRLIATARPFLNTKGEQEVFLGDAGEIYAGVIDPLAAMRNPVKAQVVWSSPRPDGTTVSEFDSIVHTQEAVDGRTPFVVFDEIGSSRYSVRCRWGEIYRLRIEGDFRERMDSPLFRGSVVCQNEDVEARELTVATGYFGTEPTFYQNSCMVNDICFEGLQREAEPMPIPLSEVAEIYFPVTTR